MKRLRGQSKTVPGVGFPGRNIVDKRISQIIGIFGDGKFSDGNETSEELRHFLSQVSKEHLKTYATQCVNEKFDGNGFALQDIVNELGKRLGFDIEHGRYRGVPGKPGHDGLWLAKNGGHSFVVESKVTDSFPIKGNELSEYREKLIEEKRIGKQNSSILLVYGRGDRERLVSQLIGSAVFASIQVVSAAGLFDLLDIKENIEKYGVRTVHDLLKPVLTVEKSIDFVRACMGQEIKPAKKTEPPESARKDKVAFSDKSVSDADYEYWSGVVSKKMGVDLHKKKGVLYDSGDNKVGVVIMVSKSYKAGKGKRFFWYGVHPKHLDALSHYKNRSFAFGCGRKESVYVLPVAEFENIKDSLGTTDTGKRMYWHVKIYETDDGPMMFTRKGCARKTMTPYLVSE